MKLLPEKFEFAAEDGFADQKKVPRLACSCARLLDRNK